MEIFLWIIAPILFSYLMFRLEKFFRQKNNNKRINERQRWLSQIRSSWRKIRIDASKCDVYEVPVKLIDYTRPQANDQTFIEYLQNEDNTPSKSTTIECFHQDWDRIKKYQTTRNVDSTVTQVKINLQGFVDVYIAPQTDYEEQCYHIDLEFLDKSIDELMKGQS